MRLCILGIEDKRSSANIRNAEFNYLRRGVLASDLLVIIKVIDIRAKTI